MITATVESLNATRDKVLAPLHHKTTKQRVLWGDGVSCNLDFCLECYLPIRARVVLGAVLLEVLGGLLHKKSLSHCIDVQDIVTMTHGRWS